MIEKLILGTVQLGLDYGISNTTGKPKKDEAFNILTNAYKHGIRVLDTAEAYGNSQVIIGEFIKQHPDLSFKIITKLDAKNKLEPNFLINHIANNCKVLNVDCLHGYMFHNYPSFKDRLDLYDQFLKAREKGLVKKIGISVYDNSEIEDILRYYDGFDIIQIPFNLLDNASKRKHLIIEANKKGIEVHTRSVFLQGLFFKKQEEVIGKLKKLGPYLNMLTEIAKSYDINIESIALYYVLQKEYIDNVLFGVETSDQLNKNIAILKNKQDIPHDLIDSLNVKEKELLNPTNWSI